MGREGRCKQKTLACARSASATLACPRSRCAYPPCPHCSGSRLLHWESSEAGPGLHAPPRSKPLRFRHLGSPQRHRLSCVWVLCPSQIRAPQVTKCRQGKHTRREQGQTQCGQDTVSTRQCYLFAVSLPPHSVTEQVSLKKCPPLPSFCHGRNQTLKRPANRRS